MLQGTGRSIRDPNAVWTESTVTKAGLFIYKLYHTAGHKGQAKGGGKKALGRRARARRKQREPGRGHYDKDRPAIIV